MVKSLNVRRKRKTKRKTKRKSYRRYHFAGSKTPKRTRRVRLHVDGESNSQRAAREQRGINRKNIDSNRVLGRAQWEEERANARVAAEAEEEAEKELQKYVSSLNSENREHIQAAVRRAEATAEMGLARRLLNAEQQFLDETTALLHIKQQDLKKKEHLFHIANKAVENLIKKKQAELATLVRKKEDAEANLVQAKTEVASVEERKRMAERGVTEAHVLIDNANKENFNSGDIVARLRP